MNDNIQIAIISAGLAALINCAFQFGDKIFTLIKERIEKKTKIKDAFIEKKEIVYIGAIKRLLQIRRGFNFTREDVAHSEWHKEKINKENDSFAEISPQLRLYSTDKIFYLFQELDSFSCYAYAPRNGPRLFENSKWAYDFHITLLAQLMQDDLGYRKLNSKHDLIVCPDCSCKHNFLSKCPKCGLSFSDLQKKAQEDLNQNPCNEDNQNNSW